jgi:hypothetical protein
MANVKKEDEQNTLDEILKHLDANEVEPDRHLSIQVDRGLREMVSACRSSGKKATLTLTFEATIVQGRRVQVAGSFKTQLPKPGVAPIQLYADEDGSLHTSDPAQLRLDLRRENPLGFGTKTQVEFGRQTDETGNVRVNGDDALDQDDE